MSTTPTPPVRLFSPAVLKPFLALFLSAAAIFLLIAAAIYLQDIRHQRSLLEQEAQHVLTLEEELLQFEFRTVQSDLLFLAQQTSLARFLDGNTATRGELQQEYVTFAENKAVYDQIRCLDTRGQEIIRVNFRDGQAVAVPAAELQDKATRYYYRQALSLGEGEVFISPFDLNVEHGRIEQPVKPVIRFLTPIFDTSGEKRGLLVLNFLGAHLLSKMKQASAGFRGETMLVNPAGEYLQAPSAIHEWGWLLGHGHSFREDFPLAWERGQNVTAGEVRVGANLFALQRVSPGWRTAASETNHNTTEVEQDSSDLIIVAYVSSAVAGARSRKLLSQLMIMYAGVLTVVAFLSLYWARSVVVRKQQQRQIVESESRLRQLSSLLLAAQETERRNLSRHLHDELGQMITAISLDLRSLERKDGGAHAVPLLQRAIEETEQLLKCLHEIAASVRPSVLDDIGFRQAVESFLADYQQRTGIDVDTQLQLPEDDLPPKVGENVFRILQEALANVAAHAQADRVEVTMSAADDMLQMTVRDAGIGFDPANDSKRLGILGMRERVELLGGRFNLHSTPGDGTRVSVWIPINQNGRP